MNSRFKPLGVVTACWLAFFSGCASRQIHPSGAAAAIPAASGVVKVPAAEIVRFVEAPEPVYRNPKIAMVTLRAHQDAEGRLLGPQVMYQIAEPGGWNIEAVERGRGFVSAANLEAQANANRSDLVPGREVPPVPPDAPLLDPERAARITITGLMREDERAEAEARARQAGQGTAAIFDREAGWLLIPGH
jgi:hypothetical protein